MTSATDLLPVLWACRFDTDYNVWVAISEAMSGLSDIADTISPDVSAALSRFTAALFEPVVELVGWDAKPGGLAREFALSVVQGPSCPSCAGEHPNTPLLRAMVLRTAAMNGSAAVISRCLSLFDDGVTSIPADLRQFVYNTVSANGGEARWQRLRVMMKAATSSEEQRRLITALGRAASPALLSSTLEMMLGVLLLSRLL